MSVAIMVQTDMRRWIIALALPEYHPSSLLFVALGLIMALSGITADTWLGLPIGTLGLITTAAGLGLVLTTLFVEILEWNRWRR